MAGSAFSLRSLGRTSLLEELLLLGIPRIGIGSLRCGTHSPPPPGWHRLSSGSYSLAAAG